MAVRLGYRHVYRYASGLPAWKAAGLPVEAVSDSSAGTSAKPEAAGPLQGWAIIWTLLGIFAGGLALNLTPCVYPLIPITVSYFGGKTGQNRASLMVHGLLYLVGLSVTNSLLGVVAALTGSLLGAALQNPLVLMGVAAVLVLFATSLFGLWEIRLPSSITSVTTKSHAGYFGSLFMGLTLCIVAAPCLGPFVLGILAWVAGMGSPWLGFLIFFTLSLGLGLPLFFLAVFSGSLSRLPGAGEWMLWVRKLMGWVMVGMAVHLVRPLLPSHLGVFLIAGVALAAGVHLGWIDRTSGGFRGFASVKAAVGTAGLLLAAFLIGAWFAAGQGIDWKPYSDELMDRAARSGKPVILDFSANWCPPCRALDGDTFHNPEVVKQAEEHFITIKVDLTQRDPVKHDALLKKYSIKGVPTVLFFDRNGKERSDLRLSSFLPPEEFLTRMRLARTGADSVSRKPN